MIEIELNNVKKNFGLKNILDGLSFDVKTGERIALIGSNGSGKSTVLKIIKGKENVDSGKVNIRKDASIELLNQIYENESEDLTVNSFLERSFYECSSIQKSMRNLENKMAIIQNTDELTKIMNQYGRLQDEYISLGGYDIQEKYNKICSGFKFGEEFLNRKYNLLSGGEKTIVNLAGILLREPSILLLDEPTNHLDVETLEWLEEFLCNYKGTILMVSHDRYFLDEVATKTVLLENGKAKIYFGNYSYFLEEDERRTIAEFEIYKNQQKQIEKMKESIKKLRSFGEIAKNEMFFKRAKSIEKRLEKFEMVDKVSLEKKTINLDLKSGGRSGKDVLRIKNLSKRFGENILFDDANLEIYYGEKVALQGKNGSGKSSLIKMIFEEDFDFDGTINIGSNVRIGYIPQTINFENDEESILEFFFKIYNGDENQTRKFLNRFMFFRNDVFKRLRELSGGEKVRIKLAELMLKDINFLILDEPTNHLDIGTREILEDSLLDYRGTILFVSHDRYFVNKIASRCLTIENREIK